MSSESINFKPNLDERLIKFDGNCFGIPERLLLDHSRGKLLFVTGAGVSYASSLPTFKILTQQIYKVVDQSVFDWIVNFEKRKSEDNPPDYEDLGVKEEVEARRYVNGDFDVALGMLERRMGASSTCGSLVRNGVANILTKSNPQPNSVHKDLLRLSDRGIATAIVTTNFDRLFQQAAGHLKKKLASYSLGSIPRPDRRSTFAGIFHIHGLLNANINEPSDLVLTEQDFGEYYLRRRIAPDFLYDALRLFDLVFVGYSLNDPPMQYLMNAVAADSTRFPDLGKRYVMIGCDEIKDVQREDWSARGFIPIFYDSSNNHQALIHTLKQWAEYSAINGKDEIFEKRVRQLTAKNRSDMSEMEQDLFDHFYRRSSQAKREQFPNLLKNGDVEWLSSMISIERQENNR